MNNFALGVLVSFCLVASANAFAADHGLFMVVKGTVKIISGKDKSQNAAKVGSKVFSGDTVVTEKDSRAKIVMADRNVLQLSPDTKFEITNYKTSAVESERTAQLALMQGKVRAQVEQKYGEKNKFEMKTPTAVAGVRGTQYVIQYNPSTAVTSIMVMSGKVIATPLSGGVAGVPLAMNQGVNIGANSAEIKAFVVSKDQMNSFSDMNETKSFESIQHEAPAAGSESRAPNSENPTRMVTSDNVGMSDANPPPPPPPVAAKPPEIPKIPKVQPTPALIGEKNQRTKVIVTPRPQ